MWRKNSAALQVAEKDPERRHSDPALRERNPSSIREAIGLNYPAIFAAFSGFHLMLHPTLGF
jgi:hypothetical protein